MPFDVHDFAGAPAEDQAAGRHNRKVVAGWLFAICGMMLVMFVLGAATRLTGSGLSIMEWAPLRGVLPPWSDAEWQRLFALYQTIPQFQLRNVGMDLAGARYRPRSTARSTTSIASFRSPSNPRLKQEFEIRVVGGASRRLAVHLSSSIRAALAVLMYPLKIKRSEPGGGLSARS